MTIFAHAGDNPKSLKALRTPSAITIDGILNETAWQNAQAAADFIQRDPDEGKPASERTEVRVLYDDEALYVGFWSYDVDPAGIVARLTRRDDEIESDHASIRIDSYHDNQTGYEFTFNAAGVKTDVLQYDDAAKEDASWDPVWQVETMIGSDGWFAEIKIPFRILRYQSGETDSAGQTWGVNFFRYISRKQESQMWAFIPKNESGIISRYGHLEGLKNLPDLKQIELLPFTVLKQNYEPERGAFPRREKFTGNAGLDLRYGLSKNFTLDATINPDFGQVEADPAVLNLSTFETFYPEKRPFFIDGTQIIRFSTFGGDFGPGMFYSRRIGRAISPGELRVPAGGRIDDIPEQATILGAVKISGRTNDGLSIGVLQAFTQEEKGTVVDSAGASTDQVVEPFAHYNVLRLKKDILGNSYIGTIFTTVAKQSRYPAFTNGYDWNLKFDQNTYAVVGFLAFSHATNSSRERITGSAGKISYSKIAGEHWLWSLSGDYTSKKYNINDVGFFFSPDDIGHVVTVTYKEDVPAEVVRNYQVSVTGHQRWTFDGANISRDFRLNGQLLFSNYWRMTGSANSEFGLYDHRETRGNGLYRKPRSAGTSTYIFSDTRNNIIFKLGQRFSWDSKKAGQSATEAGVEIRPLSWMQFAFETEFITTRGDEAWMFNDLNGVSVFGDRDTDQRNFVVRSTVTFSRELTLQFYTQIFMAKGNYSDYRQLVGTSDFISYPFSAPLKDYDFNRQSLNSNLVLRWEYSTGSTLYLVWSQARSGFTTNPFTSFSDDFDDTFSGAPSNVLLLKASYWLSI